MKEGGNEGNRSDPSYRHTVITRVKWKHQLHSYTKLGNRTVCRNQSLQHFHTELRIKGHSALHWSAVDCLPFKCGCGPSYRHTVITRVKWKHQLHSYTKLGNRTVCRNQSLRHFHTQLRRKGHSALQWSAIDCLPFKCGCGPSYRHTVITRVKWKHQLHSYAKLGNRTVCRNQSLQHFHTELRRKGHSALQWSAIDYLPFKCGRGHPGSLSTDQL